MALLGRSPEHVTEESWYHDHEPAVAARHIASAENRIGEQPCQVGKRCKFANHTSGRAARGLRRSGRGAYRVIGDQHYYRANHRDEDAVDVNTGNACRTHHGENPSADKRADDSQNDVANQPFTGLVLCPWSRDPS
jgi:hypothetical protein